MLRLTYFFHIKQDWWVWRDEMQNIFKEDKVKGHQLGESNYMTTEKKIVFGKVDLESMKSSFKSWIAIRIFLTFQTHEIG